VWFPIAKIWTAWPVFTKIIMYISLNDAPCYQWRTEGGGGVWGVKTPPRNSEVLTKLSRIHSSVENTSVTTLDIPKVWQSRTGLQIERNTWLGGYCSQIPVLSALCPQLNFLIPPPPRKKFLGTPLPVTHLIIPTVSENMAQGRTLDIGVTLDPEMVYGNRSWWNVQLLSW
jgi:hypothetical protein